MRFAPATSEQTIAVRVREDVVELRGEDDWVGVIAMEAIKEYIAPVYVDENGVEIDVEKFIDEALVLTQQQYDNIMAANTYIDDADDPLIFDERSDAFLLILSNKLNGVIDTQRRTSD